MSCPIGGSVQAGVPGGKKMSFKVLPVGQSAWIAKDAQGYVMFSMLGPGTVSGTGLAAAWERKSIRARSANKAARNGSDSESLARERSYATSNASEALAAFRSARARTLNLISSLSPEQFARTATFEGYGALSLRSLVHYLCSHDRQHLAGMQWLLGKIEAARTGVLV